VEDLLVHPVLGHIVVDLFAVLLLLFLDVVEGITNILVSEFKDTSIVIGGYIFFSGQCIVTKELIVLFVAGGGRGRGLVGRRGGGLVRRRGGGLVRRRGGGLVGRRGGGLAGRRGAVHLRNSTGCDLIQSFHMLLFYLGDLIEQITKLTVTGLLGILVVLVHAKLFLASKIL
jgi:hypothetical protein